MLTNCEQCQLRKLAFALKNSTTILLPQWYKTLTAHKLPPRMMVRDVTTRWNSTYDMLEFAVQYRPAIDAMTAIRDLDLRKYELASSEWKIAAELRDVLKVRLDIIIFYLFLRISNRSSRMLPSFSLVEHQIFPLSFLPWTTSTRCLPHHRTAHTSFPWPFVLPLLSGKVL